MGTQCIEPGGKMSEQTSGAETVRIPGQTRPSEPASESNQGYEPRHRAAPVAAEEPTVVPPSGHLASQRRARAASVHARTVALRTVPPEATDEVPRVYDTPVWVPSARTGEVAGQLPALAAVDDDADALARPEGMIRHARWSSARRANLAAAFLLVGFLAAAVATGSGLLWRQSTPTLALTLACLLGAAGVYALLVVLRPVVVELAEPWLSVQRGSRFERFNLASPFQELHVSGRARARGGWSSAVPTVGARSACAAAWSTPATCTSS
jgi:hypothetical protein